MPVVHSHACLDAGLEEAGRPALRRSASLTPAACRVPSEYQPLSARELLAPVTAAPAFHAPCAGMCESVGRGLPGPEATWKAPKTTGDGEQGALPIGCCALCVLAVADQHK